MAILDDCCFIRFKLNGMHELVKAIVLGTLFEGRIIDWLHEESMRIQLDGLFIWIEKRVEQIPDLSMRGM